MWRILADRWQTDSRFRLLPAMLVLAYLAVFPNQTDAGAEELETAVSDVIERYEAAVVSIARIVPDSGTALESAHKPLNRPISQMPRSEFDYVPNDFGTGFLISHPDRPDRYLLTNYHVVRGGPVFPQFITNDRSYLRIHFHDRRGAHAAMIAADPRSDLAVLRLDWEKSQLNQADFPVLNWEKGPAPRKGQFVVMMGNPHAIARDGSASVSWGMISNLTRQPISFNPMLSQDQVAASSMLYRLGSVMQLDARLNLGTSGGPVFNLKGDLIGISSSLAAIEGYDQTVGFAIPIEPLTRRIILTLLEGREVEYGMLGIGPTECAADEFQNLKTGLPQRSATKVSAVHPGSPARTAGIQEEDLIVAVEGTPVQSVADLMRLVGLHPPESEINITIWRKPHELRPGRSETVKVRLGKWAVHDADGIIETNPRFPPWRGMTIDYATARQQQLGHSLDFNRVMVTRVEEGSPAQVARLERGNFITHINNVPVRTPREFYAEIQKKSGPVQLRLADDTGEYRSGRVIIIGE